MIKFTKIWQIMIEIVAVLLKNMLNTKQQTKLTHPQISNEYKLLSLSKKDYFEDYFSI